AAPPAPVAPTLPAAVQERPQQTFGVTLSDGKNQQLLCVATRRRDGGYTTCLQVIERAPDGKVKSSERGATQKHANVEEARAAIDKAVNLALKQGWIQRRGRGGYLARPDTFDLNSIPKPKGVKR